MEKTRDYSLYPQYEPQTDQEAREIDRQAKALIDKAIAGDLEAIVKALWLGEILTLEEARLFYE